MAAKSVSIIGSTGFIGTQTLDVIDRSNGRFRVTGLACGGNIPKVAEQAIKYRPRAVSVEREEDAHKLRQILGPSIQVFSGQFGIRSACIGDGTDVVVNAAVGVAGFIPTLQALEAGKTLLLANKESIVIGGELVMETAKRKKAAIISIDSEHSGILQCLRGNENNRIEKVYITASGGPFYGRKRHELLRVTPNEALKHPTWNMGRRITIDSATLFNKGFELIEARYFYGVEPHQVEAVVDRSSKVHAMVQFEDSSMIMQVAVPDMRLPIQYALYYPERPLNALERPQVEGMSLQFLGIDHETFKGISMARFAMERGGVMGAVLNGADEEAVKFFLDRKIGFLQIGDYVEKVMKNWESKHSLDYFTYEGLIAADTIARAEIGALVEQAEQSRS